MATFPTLTPSGRTFSPGRHPHSEIRTLDGLQARVRTSNVLLEQRLRLTFVALTETQMLSIRSHYNGQQGRFLSFDIPTSLLSGMASPASFTPTGYSWIYATTPQIEDIGLQRYTVNVELITVPPEGANINGSEFNVYTSLVAGQATTSAEIGGSTFTVNTTLVPGVVEDNESAGFNLTVPISLAAGTASAPSSDPFFSNVKHLLHMDGANGSTTYVNSSTSGLNVGVTSSMAQSTAQFKFGTASGFVDNFDGLSLPSSVTSQYAFGTGDWTVELWLYLNTHTGVNRQVTHWFYGSTGAGIMINTSNTLSIRTTATQTSGATVVPLNTWNHLALTRASNVHRLFLNGVLQGGTWTNPYSQTNSYMIVGSNTTGSSPLGTTGNTAYIDELRITAGIARYTSNFTPPATAFPNS